ncbi:MAG: FTR1 family protein [Gemmatimonadota bacterium]
MLTPALTEFLPALLAAVNGAEEPLAPWAAFAQSFGLILREGFEALLLCTALAAAAVRRGGRPMARAIWQGALAAIVASLATAVLVARVLHLADAGREAIEGVTMLLAAGVLFYVSYWLLSKLEVARWMGYLRDQVGTAGSRWALAGVAFLAVYREGVETVLFYQALSGLGAAGPLWAGGLAGIAALAVAGLLIVRFGLKLPTRPLFALTSLLLYYLAIVFAGQGVHELQEAGWFSETAVAGAPRIGWLGVYPTIETLGVQWVLLLAAVIAAIILLRRCPSAA